MSEKPKVDLIAPVLQRGRDVVQRLQRVLDLGGEGVASLTAVEDRSTDRDTSMGLAKLAAADPRVRVLRCSSALGWAARCNLGLKQRWHDVVLLESGVLVSKGWLHELIAAAYSEERTALASPVSLDDDPSGPSPTEARQWVTGLPRWIAAPQGGRGCNYLRGDALDAVGPIDPRFRTPDAAIDDWLMRARSLGFFAKRANHALVAREARQDDDDDASDREVLNAKHPFVAAQVGRFDASLDASLARHAIELQASSRLRVGYDVRHLPMGHNGTKMYALSLAKALAVLPEIDLTMIATHPIQAEGVPARVVSPDEWADDAAVLHKPAQIFDPRHAKLLFQSRAHVVVTYQDLIAYRLPGVFGTEDDYNAYLNTSRLTLPAAQGVLAYSQNTAREIADEFGIPVDEIAPIFLGVDVESFGSPVAAADEIRARLHLPSRYFLGLASDYPHKNLEGLLEAYAMLRDRWGAGSPPALVLAGDAPRMLASSSARKGVAFLGSVSDPELRVVYQNAEALVFSSIYEGFGLPPLEAMAAGSPVVAMPFSSVPEVCGDAALYSDGLSHAELATAMLRLATDRDLRDDLIARGRRRIESLHWQATARSTYEVYRKAVLNPSARSLQMRRSLQAAIALWAEPVRTIVLADRVLVPEEQDTQEHEEVGIVNACNYLNAAVRKRLRRELNRLTGRDRRSA